MSEPKPWGPDNPHPLSTRKTELIWEGKYDEYGNRRPVSLPSFPLVMQRIETIDAPRDRAKAQGALWEETSAHRDDFRNRLIWGDNKLALAALLPEFRGRVDLIYIDPPFDVGADFTVDLTVGEAGDGHVHKEQSVLEAVAYRDTWGRGTDSYLAMLEGRLVLMRELLSSRGAIIVHVGDKVAGHVSSLMADVFGPANYRNTIIVRRGIKNVQAQFANVRGLSVGNDYLILYTKAEATRLAKLSRPGAEATPGKWDTFWRGTDRETMRYELFGVTPRSGQWRWSRARAYAA
ncbi:MAG TPA: DNA methyltransferase, partial [Chthonomonadaceae bacterium]|nr:DNA methyltransferase [Chthonomonadaceae bacterium]